MLLTALALISIADAKPTEPPELRIEGITPTSYEARLTLDPSEDRFTGTAKASLSLDGKHKVIWLNAIDLQVSEASLWVDGQQSPLTLVEGDGHHIGFAPKKPAKGDVVLEIAYSGDLREEFSDGAFVQEEEGERYVLTQFESTDARRVFPCVDDPQHKIPWTLTLDVPEAIDSFSNTPVETEEVAQGRRVTQFATTKPMPSYLVAFAAGPFEAVDGGTAGRNNTPVRILVPKGRGEHAAWAAESTPPVLETLEAYFDQPYPYAKLDVITIPQAVQFGAMEHPGLVTFTQSLVIARPEDDTEQRRRIFAEVQGHELGHMWFGNLVTPMWWDDIWLNESFASWIATKATDTQWPDWNAGAGRVSSRNSVMGQDSLTTARQIREPIAEFDDIQAAFDGITYAKGQAVLEMTEAWLGEDVFRKGVQLYMNSHAWGNATAEDFLESLGAAAKQDVASTMLTFLEQPGVPLVNMTLDCEGTPAIDLSQERFLASGESDDSVWQIPVCVRHDGGRECFLLTEPTARFELDTESCPTTLVPNDRYTGYYRANVGPEATQALLDGEVLSTEERLGLIGDTAALIEVGKLPPTLLLDQAESLANNPDPLVVRSGLSVVSGISERLVADDQRAIYAAFVQRTYGPVAAQLGWEPREGEPQEVSGLRASALSLVAGDGQDEAIRVEARRRADQWLETREGTDPTLVPTALGLAARYGDKALFDTMSAQAIAEEDRGRRTTLLAAIGAFEDPEIIPAVLELSGHDAFNIRERGPLLFGPAMRPATQPAAWSFIAENIDEIEKSVPGIARSYIIYLASGFCSEEGAETAESFFAERSKKYLSGKRALALTAEGIRLCETTVARQAPQVRTFLEAEAERQAADDNKPTAAEEGGEPTVPEESTEE